MNLTATQKANANKVYHYLQLAYPTVSTKEDIMQECGINNERTVRECIQIIRQQKPVIAYSSGKGYKLARALCDYEDAKHTAAELASRIQELENNLEPLNRFMDKCIEVKNANNV